MTVIGQSFGDSAPSIQLGDDVDEEAVRSRDQIRRLIANLDEVAPALTDEIEVNERSGLLSDRTLELIRKTAVPSMLIPASMGGLGMFPRDALVVLEHLCQIDASIGWIGSNWSSTGLMLSFISPDAGREVLDGGQPLFGASGAPTGVAVPVEGGFTVSGAWSYGSGDLHADYVILTALRAGTDGVPVMVDGKPLMGGYIVRGTDIQPKGNWDTLGLRATGSVDFKVEDAFVPDHYAFDYYAPPKSTRQSSGGVWVILTMLHTAFALGAARRLLDELAAFAGRPSSRGTKLADDSVFRDQYARREVAVHSARAFVYEVWDDIDARLKTGRELDRRAVTLLRAAMLNLHDAARELAIFAFQKGGGVSLRAGVLQRWVRDTLAGCQHLLASDTAYADIGRDLLGAAENAIWTPAGLLDQ